jgi:hypothetical protein
MSHDGHLDAMRLGVNYSGVITIRGFSLRVRPLSISESIEVAAKVTDRILSLPKSGQNRLSENTFLALETLALASTSDVGANDPKITDYTLTRMTPDELAAVFKAYVAECDRVNPALERMTAEDVTALIESLKKSAGDQVELDSRLTELSLSELASIVSSFLTNVG